MDKEKNSIKCLTEKISFYQQEKEAFAAELILANKKLAFQNREIKKRTEELIVANMELAFQNEEKEKRAAELIIANKWLEFQNKEKERLNAESIVISNQLAIQIQEKEERAAELILSNLELRQVDENLKVYIRGLEEMMFMASHQVRQPISQILGLTDLLCKSLDSPEHLRKLAKYLERSALALDAFTKELTLFMTDLKTIAKNKKGIAGSYEKVFDIKG